MSLPSLAMIKKDYLRHFFSGFGPMGFVYLLKSMSLAFENNITMTHRCYCKLAWVSKELPELEHGTVATTLLMKLLSSLMFHKGYYCKVEAFNTTAIPILTDCQTM